MSGAQRKGMVITMKLSRIYEIDTDSFKVGDVISFTLNDGEEVKALAVRQTDNGMLFCFVDCLVEEYAMNQKATNKGGYFTSDLRDILNGEILGNFPAELRDCLLPFGNGDLLRLPTEREIFGKNFCGDDEPETIVHWKPMELRKNRVAFRGKNGGWEWYWLINKLEGSSSNFVVVDGNGFAAYDYASTSFGVRPVFKISHWSTN